MKGLALSMAQMCVGWVKETTGANDGPWIEAMQRVTGNKAGDPWCASFVAFCLGIAFKGKSPLPATASCDALLVFARKSGRLIPLTDVEPGDVFLVMAAGSDTDAIHTGFVTAVHPAETGVDTIEGNTNPGGSRDGWGVFQRSRPVDRLRFIRV